MPEPARLAREKMHVLADAAEVRVVVLGDERDPQRRAGEAGAPAAGWTSVGARLPVSGRLEGGMCGGESGDRNAIG